ncbi:MAG: hypothetical protein GF353_23945 [Candidatus Lokiarchaeota archaeon]|nr:hypothetical protein [Candidatus Lokiarchaeota archaeon]
MLLDFIIINIVLKLMLTRNRIKDEPMRIRKLNAQVSEYYKDLTNAVSFSDVQTIWQLSKIITRKHLDIMR